MSESQHITRSDYRHPKRMVPIIRAIEEREPRRTPTPEQESFAACLGLLAGEEGGGGTGIEISGKLPRARLVIYLAELACTGRESDALAASGLGWSEVMACEFLDKGGFKVLALRAREMRNERLREICADTLSRMVQGIDEPVIGRVAKDRDGVVKDEAGNDVVRRRYYEKATLFALERLSKRFQLPAGGGGGGGGSVTYNITFNQRPADAPNKGGGQVTDAEEIAVPPPGSGGTLAELAGEL